MAKSHDTTPLLIELGCEEIPAAVAPKMAQALLEKLPAKGGLGGGC